MNFKKKLFAGLLGGMIFLSGSHSFAEEMPDNAWQEEEAAHIGGWTKYFAENYSVDPAQIEKAFQDGVHVNDIRFAAVLSKISGKNFADVLAMKVDWFQVAQKLGISQNQLKNFFENERDEHFAKHAGIDVKTLQNLLKDGYDPRDISIAGKIAQASGKNIKNVLEKRRINNTWDDVAQSFGVDLKKIMPPPRKHHEQAPKP